MPCGYLKIFSHFKSIWVWKRDNYAYFSWYTVAYMCEMTKGERKRLEWKNWCSSETQQSFPAQWKIITESSQERKGANQRKRKTLKFSRVFYRLFFHLGQPLGNKKYIRHCWLHPNSTWDRTHSPKHTPNCASHSMCAAQAIHRRPKRPHSLVRYEWLCSVRPNRMPKWGSQTQFTLDCNPVFKAQLNLNMNVLLCFAVLLSYSVLHLDLEMAVLQFDVSSHCIMYTVASFYEDLCATSYIS